MITLEKKIAFDFLPFMEFEGEEAATQYVEKVYKRMAKMNQKANRDLRVNSYVFESLPWFRLGGNCFNDLHKN